MLVKTEAIVLRYMDFQEADRIVTFFTKHYGKIKAVAKGVRKTKSRFGSSMEPFTHLRVMFFKNPNKDLYLVTQHNIISSFYSLRKDFESFINASYICELIDKFVTHEEKQIELWWLLLRTLEFISKVESEILLRFFEIRILSILGFSLNERVLPAKAEIRNIIRKFQEIEFSELPSLNFSSDLLLEIKNILLQLLHRFSETEYEFKSIDFAKKINS